MGARGKLFRNMRSLLFLTFAVLAACDATGGSKDSASSVCQDYLTEFQAVCDRCPAVADTVAGSCRTAVESWIAGGEGCRAVKAFDEAQWSTCQEFLQGATCDPLEFNAPTFDACLNMFTPAP